MDILGEYESVQNPAQPPSFPHVSEPFPERLDLHAMEKQIENMKHQSNSFPVFKDTEIIFQLTCSNIILSIGLTMNYKKTGENIIRQEKLSISGYPSRSCICYANK